MAGAVAVILARGGSKGLPRKNVLPVAGRPCVRWSIDAACAAETIDRVLVSSDDDEVLMIAEEAGVRTHRRDETTAGDHATVDAAAREALRELDADRIVILYGNVPVRPEGLIDRAVRLLDETGCDSVQSYAPVGKHHPWWTARVDAESGLVSPWQGDVLNHGVFRRQDLPPAHIPDGGVIALTRRALMLKIAGVPPGPHAFFGLDRRGVLTGEGEVVDIDGPADLMVAQAALAGGAPRRTTEGTEVTEGARRTVVGRSVLVQRPKTLVDEDLTHEIIGAAIEVHREIGPGLLESAYERCLLYELGSRGVAAEAQVLLPLRYRSLDVAGAYRIDLDVDRRVIVELKTVDRVLPVHEAQLMTYMRLADRRVGLILNFHAPRMKDGIVRRVM